MHPINRLPADVFTLIPRFLTNDTSDHDPFPMNRPLVTMTHVCQSWRDVLFSIPSLWTQLDFSKSTKSQQAEDFLGRSGERFLDVYQFLDDGEDIEPFLPIILRNAYRLRRLEIFSSHPHLEHVLARFARPAPELKHLEIENDFDITNRDIVLPSTIFGGQLPKLTSLSLHRLCTDLRDFNFPSLTRFTFVTGTTTSVRDLTSFIEKCPSLEFIRISLKYFPLPPTTPPLKRIRLGALKELRFNITASTSGLLNHLALPGCTEVVLGEFRDDIFSERSYATTRIHPSSIDHLPVTRGITKAVAVPNSCILSGPNGNLRIWCLEEARGNFDAEVFTSFSLISVLQIRELWVGRNIMSHAGTTRKFWEPTAAGVYGAFGVLTKVEDLTLVNCQTQPFFLTLGVVVGGGVLLPGLRRLTVFVGCGCLDVPAPIQCAEARKEYFRPLGVVTIVFEEPQADFVEGAKSLREFVGELIYRVGEPGSRVVLGR